MNTFIRVTSILAVLGIAVVAGWVSYAHGYHVALAHHESGTLAMLYPITVDGLIYSASMVVLDHNRRQLAVPRLARWVLGIGISIAVVANVWFGIVFGWTTAVIAAWPAPSLVLAYELLMRIIRNQAGDEDELEEERPEPVRSFGGVQAKPANTAAAATPTTSHRKRARHAPGAPTIEAAEREFQHEISLGIVPNLKEISSRLRVGSDKAKSYQRHFEVVGRANREAA